MKPSSLSRTCRWMMAIAAYDSLPIVDVLLVVAYPGSRARLRRGACSHISGQVSNSRLCTRGRFHFTLSPCSPAPAYSSNRACPIDWTLGLPPACRHSTQALDPRLGQRIATHRSLDDRALASLIVFVLCSLARCPP